MQINGDICAKDPMYLGFVPPVFSTKEWIEYIPEEQQILWQQAHSAYLNNPLPLLFREKLVTYLSRYCSISACMVCQSYVLHRLGMATCDILMLLDTFPPTNEEIEQDMVAIPGSLIEWPQAGSALETLLFFSAVKLFLLPKFARRSSEELRRLLKPADYAHLVALLSYVKISHAWIEAYPELSDEDDKRVQSCLEELLADEPRLQDFLQNYGIKVGWEWSSRRNLRTKRDDDHEIGEDDQDEHAQLRSLGQSNIIGTFSLDINGPFVDANDVFLQMLGYTREEMQAGKVRWETLTPPEYVHADRQALKDLIIDGICSPYEKQCFCKDGSRISVIVGGVFLDLPSMTCVGYVLDISKRKQLEEALRQSAQEASARAQELEAIFEAMVDAVAIYNSEGKMLHANRAYYEFLGTNILSSPPPIAELDIPYTVCDKRGQLLPKGQQGGPLSRVLGGETLKDVNTIDILLHPPSGREMRLELSGAPIYDQERNIAGAIIIGHDVTERRKLEQHTEKALNALITMAEALVQAPSDASSAEHTPRTASLVGQRLAELTGSVLGCKRVAILRLEPGTKIAEAVAAFGFSPELDALWRTHIPRVVKSGQYFDPVLATRLRQNEALVLDRLQSLALHDLLTAYGIYSMMVVPMYVGSQLIGVLAFDYDSEFHEYSPQEIAFARAVTKLVTLVFERERLLQERTEARATELALREANRRMDEFIGIASHELRTPLTTIIANVQMSKLRLKRLIDPRGSAVEKQARMAEDIGGMLNRAERQLWRLNRLVNDLLDVSRIQADKLSLRMAQADLCALVKDIFDEQCQVNPTRLITLNIPCEQPVPVMIDGDRIGQVMTNYLSNALKYSETDCPIKISLELEGSHVCISVQDYGPGIPLEEQQYIWDRFYRVQTIAVQSGTGVGLGLGLHICRVIIERHEGEVGVWSTPGQGSTFWLKLPLVHS